jgi:hypothetical protein
MKLKNHINIKKMNFEQLFKQISPEEICRNAFTFAGEGFSIKGFPVITAGKDEHYNSMTGSGGGLGLLLRKPAIWCVLRADRYTLELMQKEQTYTMSYFPDAYKKQVLFGGNQSRRGQRELPFIGKDGVLFTKLP